MNNKKSKKIFNLNDETANKIKCIVFGTFIGACVYKFCLVINLAIFGWNLGLVLSPLIAGYAETYLAKRFLKETTGAVSAFILFLITVIYGFIISNSSLGFNLITIITTVIILQSAFPIAINYILIRISVLITKSLHRAGSYIQNKVIGKVKKKTSTKANVIDLSDEDYEPKEINTNNLGVSFLTSSNIQDRNILDYKGLFESRQIIKYDQKENIKSRTIEERNSLLLKGVNEGKKKAIVDLANQLKNENCNGILEINIEYDTLKTEKSSLVIQISISGTGVIIE